jgi:hypothetical protein
MIQPQQAIPDINVLLALEPEELAQKFFFSYVNEKATEPFIPGTTF